VTIDEEIPRNLSERTGRHFCTQCLREVSGEVFARYDHLCEECAAAVEEFPNASTPGHAEPAAGKR